MSDVGVAVVAPATQLETRHTTLAPRNRAAPITIVIMNVSAIRRKKSVREVRPVVRVWLRVRPVAIPRKIAAKHARPKVPTRIATVKQKKNQSTMEDFTIQNAQPILDQLRFMGIRLDLKRLQQVYLSGVILAQDNTPLNVNVIHLLSLALKNIQELNAKVHDLEMQLLLLGGGHDDVTDSSGMAIMRN